MDQNSARANPPGSSGAALEDKVNFNPSASHNYQESTSRIRSAAELIKPSEESD